MDTKAKVLDIAMNLNRIGNWATDDYGGKEKRIVLFLRQTSEYVDSVNLTGLKEPFKTTFQRFINEYQKLMISSEDKNFDELLWAEKMMTWGNILTHRVKLL